MGFWKLINNKKNSGGKSSLELSLEKEFPNFKEKTLEKLTCISGLMASIAYNDFVIEEGEVQAMKDSLKTWVELSEEEVLAISTIAVEHSKELVGLEEHLYTRVLNEILSKDDKYHLIESLFFIAASDGNISMDESEHIKTIAHALKLPREFYTAAKAKFI